MGRQPNNVLLSVRSIEIQMAKLGFKRADIQSELKVSPAWTSMLFSGKPVHRPKAEMLSRLLKCALSDLLETTSLRPQAGNADALSIHPNLTNPLEDALTAIHLHRQDISLPTVLKLLSTKLYSSARKAGLFLGDVSVDVTGNAYATPLDSKMYVAIIEAREFKVICYEPRSSSSREGIAPSSFQISQSVSDTYLEKLNKIFNSTFILENFPQYAQILKASFTVHIISETPGWLSLYEEISFAVALSRALRKHLGLRKHLDQPESEEEHFEMLRFAAFITSAWYLDVSFATHFACASDTPNTFFEFKRHFHNEKPLLTLLEASVDEEICFDTLSDVVSSLYIHNIKGARKQDFHFTPLRQGEWRPEQLSIWCTSRNKSARNQRGLNADLVAKLKEREVSFNFICNDMANALQTAGNLQLREIGWCMQRNNLLLTLLGFIKPEIQEVVSSICGIKDVLGTKIAAGSWSGALLVLTSRLYDGIPGLEKSMHMQGYRHIENFRINLSLAMQRAGMNLADSFDRPSESNFPFSSG